MTKYNCSANISGYIDFEIEAENEFEAARLAEYFVKKRCADKSEDYNESSDGSYRIHISQDDIWVEGSSTTGIFLRDGKRKFNEASPT